MISRWLLLFFPFTLFASDFEVWTRGAFVTEISKNVELSTLVGFRFRENASHLYHEYVDLGVLLTGEKWIILPSYRQTRERVDGGWEIDRNPRLTFFRFWKKKPFEFVNRTRLEYRSRRGNLLIRNQFFIQFQDLLPFRLAPFISDEVFFDKLTDFTQNRLKMGVITPFREAIEASIGYMYRSKKRDQIWFYDHVLLCYFTFEF